MIKKKIAWLISLVFVLAPFFSGCGIFHPPSVDKDGYYTDHFYSCGPRAIEKAINEYYRKQGIVFAKNPAPNEEVSKLMQDEGQALKRLLSLFNKEVVQVTWSWEMKSAAKKFGFELINVKDFEKLDPSKDIALVLVYGKFISSQWHWTCYPVDKNITTHFGEDTKIDEIYLFKKTTTD